MTPGLAAIALAGLKTRHYTGRRRDRDGRPGAECGSGGHRAGGSEDPPLQLKGAEIGMAGLARNAAVAAVDKGEGTQRGTVLGAIGGHGSLQKERLDLGFLGEPRGGEAHF